jgi:hypothetical protein
LIIIDSLSLCQCDVCPHSLLLPFFSFNLDDFGNVVGGFALVVPIEQFVENEGFTRFDSILTIKSSLHLHRICGSVVTDIENFENGKVSRWLHVVPEIDIWESSHIFKNVVHAVVVVFDVLVPQEVFDGVGRDRNL